MPVAGHALWVEVGGDILCVTLGEFSGLHKNAPVFLGGGSDPICMVPYMLALAGQPSLYGYYACMVFWVKGAFWRNCMHFLCKTSFSRFLVSLCSLNFFFWWRGMLVWHLWIGRPDILVPILLTHGDLVLDTEVDF